LFAIIDIETTGNKYNFGKITEIAIFQHNGQKVTGSYSTLIDPEMDIPFFITRLTGIDNNMVKDAPKFYEVAKKIIELTQGRTFIAHNVSFDYKFIKEEYKRLGYEYSKKTLCTVKLSRKLLPGHKSYSLGKLCSDLGIEINGRHRAAGDAIATVKLFEILLEKNKNIGDSKAINNYKLF
jgi:DNA polymerase III subunit epsilon